MIIFLIGAVQFVNILDFMMVMPMGPDFSKALAIPASELGLIGASYTAAAAIAGFAGAFFLDRFDRRKALAVAILGLAGGTALGGFAIGLKTLILARIVAGCFGGPATSVAMAIIADAVPPERRGRALGAVMGAFSVASVLGVPAGLEMARIGGWRLPFFAVAGLAVILNFMTFLFIPPLRAHLAHRKEHDLDISILSILKRPAVQFGALTGLVVMISSFAIIPNISAYLQYNAGYPREHLGLLYLFGGGFTFFTMRIAGRLTDRFGTMAVFSIATVLLSVLIFVAFGMDHPLFATLPLFVTFMVFNSTRNVAFQTIVTKIPRPVERARFQSLQSMIQHMGGAIGGVTSTFFLREVPGPHLEGMGHLALFAIGLSFIAPFLIYQLERQMRGATPAKVSAFDDTKIGY